MDIISRLPGCDGQAVDAVSVCSQVKMADVHKLVKIPKSECTCIWIRPPRNKWPESSSSKQDPVVPLEMNLYGHPLSKTIIGKAVWENLVENMAGRKFQLGMSLCTSWKKIILICVCGWHKIGWKETKSWSDVVCAQSRSRFGRTHLSWIMCIGAALNDNVNKWRCGHRTMFESRIFAGEQKKFHSRKISVFLHGFVMLFVMQRNVELANKTTQQLQSTHPMHWWPSHQRRRNKELNQWNSSKESPFIHNGEKWRARTKSRSELPVWTVSQKFSHLQWRRLFKEFGADQQQL